MASFSRLTLLKFAELILVIICVILHHNSLRADSNTNLILLSGTYGGYLIIMIAVFMGFFVDSSVGRRTDLYFTILGGVLYLTCAYVVYKEFDVAFKFNTDEEKYGMAKVWASVITGILFFVDAIFVFRGD